MLRSFVILALLNCLLWDISNAYALTRQKESFTCPAIDGFYTVSGKCAAEYYVCVGGESFLQKCPGMGNVFDSSISRCLPLTSSSCRSARTTVTEVGTETKIKIRNLSNVANTADETTFICPTPEGFFPIPGTCSQDFFICVNGIPSISTCPSGSVFDPGTNVCTSIESASCQPEFQCPNPDGFFPVPGTCDGNYYSCVGGQAYLQTCPSGSVFDPETYVCTPIESASCLPEFKCPTPDGFFPVPGAVCDNIYYSCVGGQAYLQHCPGTSIFDPETNMCVAESSSSCKTTTFITTTPTPTAFSRSTFSCPEDGYYPDPTDCHQFYICNSGIAFLSRCVEGKCYNAELSICSPGPCPNCPTLISAHTFAST